MLIFNCTCPHRCICPYGTWGSRCKMVARHFHGGGEGGGEEEPHRQGGWAWVPAIPPCTEVHLSMEVLTEDREAILLYSGGSEGAPRQEANSDLLLLQLLQGRPALLLDLGAGPVSLALNASYSLADNTWHRIDLIWKDEVTFPIC